MLNKPAIRKLAEHLESLDPSEFDLRHYGRCIAGHAVALTGQNLHELNDHEIHMIAAESLGLNSLEANRLFVPFGLWPRTYDEVTPQQAARVLRGLDFYGTIDWQLAFRRDVHLDLIPESREHDATDETRFWKE